MVSSSSHLWSSKSSLEIEKIYLLINLKRLQVCVSSKLYPRRNFCVPKYCEEITLREHTKKTKLNISKGRLGTMSQMLSENKKTEGEKKRISSFGLQLKVLNVLNSHPINKLPSQHIQSIVVHRHARHQHYSLVCMHSLHEKSQAKVYTSVSSV